MISDEKLHFLVDKDVNLGLSGKSRQRAPLLRIRGLSDGRPTLFVVK